MKISALLPLLSMAYVASAAKAVQQSTQLMSTMSAVPGAGAQVPTFPAKPGVASGLEAVPVAVSSNTNSVNSRVTTTHQSTATQMYPGSVDGDKPYVREVYRGYVTGAYPGFNNGAYQGYIRADYPGLSIGAYPGSFYAHGRELISPVYLGLLQASQRGLVGSAYSRYFSRMKPGFFRRALRSLYGSRLLGNGAAEMFPMGFGGNQVGFTFHSLTGRQVLYPASHPAQLPEAYPGVLQPPSTTANIGATAVSQSQVVVPAIVGSAATSAHQQSSMQAQSQVHLVRGPAE